MNYLKIFIICCFPCVIVAQSNKQVSFRDLTVDHGLSQNSVTSIAQDSTGYLWFATQDGLNKYDGREFKYFKKQFEDVTRPNYSRLGKIYVDKQNTFWLITLSGVLEKYNSKNKTFKPISRFNSVSSIYQDTSLNIYIGTYDQGLFKIDATTKDTLQLLKKEDVSKAIYDYVEYNDGLLVTATNAVFNIAKNNEYNILTLPNSLNYNSITTSKNKSIWLGTFGNGLYSLNLAKNQFSQFEGLNDFNLPTDLNIQDLLFDSKNRLWIASYGKGVYLIDFDQNDIQHFTANKNNPIAISYNDVLTLFEDFTGTIWLGTDGGGANYYDEHLAKFNVLTNNQTPENINIDVIRAITTDNDNNIWLGTSGKGLSKVSNDKKTFETYTAQNSKISSNRIMSLLVDNTDLWIGHQGGGLNILDAEGHFISFDSNSKVNLPASTIWCMYKDFKNQIWLGTRDHGLILFDKYLGVIEQFVHNDTLNTTISSNNIRALVADNQSTLWVGTDDKGLCALNLNTKETIRIPEISNQIKSLYFDGTNTLWIGTNGDGLKSYNIITKQVQEFTVENGLPNNVIYGILSDNNQNLWLSSNRGITKFNTQNLIITNFNNYDGLQAFEFNTGAAYKDTQNNLYFGGIEGLNWFNPDKITFNPTLPKTVISKFEIFTKAQTLEQNQAFKSSQNTVTFTFSSLHFSQPERNLYKYQLVNHDQDWIESGNINTAHYTNLPPSTYTFKVISSNYDGVWNTDPATYTFTIKQFWYLSTIAIICYIILLVVLIFSIYNYLKWRWHIKMQLQFEQKETVRLKQLDEFKTKLYTNLSHEFRTPLTLISGPIEKQLSKPNLSAQDQQDLNLVERNSKRLLNLVNQLLDLAKLESGNLKLNVSNGNLNALLKQLVSAFKFKAEQKNIKFINEIQPIDKAWFDKDVVEKIVTNLLSNAIKYTPEGGSIHFKTALQNGQILITIINSGTIITQEELPKLFQRFYQNHKSKDGVGIGLSLVKELAILSHGNIVANLMNTDDIQFSVTLPIERSFYISSEIEEQASFNKAQKQNTDLIKSGLKPNKKSKHKSVLHIIEDDDDVRLFIKSIFEDSYQITEAINGKEGIVNALKEIPDIIISDIMMPVVDGIEVCNTLKQDNKTSHIPIILLTAKSGDQNEIKGLLTGADHYITKPFNSEKLKVRVEKLIQLRLQLQQRYSHNLNLKDIETTSVDEKFLTKLKDVLDTNITDVAFNSERLSKKMLMSRMQLHRKLNALTGLSTTELIRNERLKLSLAFLKHSDITVSEIAYQVGFNTPSYFIKCFKQVYKTTPSTYY